MLRGTGARVLCALAAALWMQMALAAPGLREVLERSDASLPRGQWVDAPMPVRTLPNGETDRTLAPYFHVAGEEGGERLPLEETTADVQVAGVIARVRLRQVFKNDGSTPIEAIYVFPASTRAAIHGLTLRIDERTIEGRIQKREEAKATYEAAKSEGKRTALLEQQRPNVFTTRVANVMPKDRIVVELEYSELLVPEEGIYELVIPGVVGPRYGGGGDPAKDQWIASPYTTEGTLPSWRYDVRATLQTALPLRDLSSPSHPVTVTWRSKASAEVTLADERPAGNKDYILRWRLADEQVQTGVLAWRGGAAETANEDGYFAVLLEGPSAPKPEQVAPREYIFVVDISGSMHGFPLEVSKTLMRELLGRLRATDHFNVVVFAGASATFSSKSVPATPANVERGIAFIDKAHAGGGTELLAALRTAYALPRVGGHTSRTVVLATDGYVAVEAQAFKFVRERLGDANLFAFGIGTGVNRALIEGLARAGSGEPWVLTSAETAPKLAERFRRAIEEPVLTDITIRFRGFDARDVAPVKLPDLMARRPLVVQGRFTGPLKGEIEVSGRTGDGRRWSRTLPVQEEGGGEALRLLWARKWVELLEDQHHLTNADEVKDAITDLGLSHRLVTPFTSFVAVDSEVANRTGTIDTVQQPLPLPEGVSNNAVGLLGGAGLGARGSGPGGGGAGLGLGGLGGFGTAGRGAGAGALPAPSRVTVMDPKTAPRVQGSLSKEAVQRVLRRHTAEIRYCYEGQLQKLPNLKGKLIVRFVIGADGAVKTVEVVEKGTTAKSEALNACVIKRMQRWRFPSSNGGEGGDVTVVYPWQLTPAPRER